jgi:hypothetical protein
MASAEPTCDNNVKLSATYFETQNTLLCSTEKTKYTSTRFEKTNSTDNFWAYAGWLEMKAV